MLSKLLTLEHVDILILLNSVKLEDLHDVVREAAPWHLSVSFHEQAYVILADPLINLLSEIITLTSNFRLGSKV